MISIKQDHMSKYHPIRDDRFWQDVGLFSPLLVETQAEADWLWAMQLMVGKEFVILVDGKDENKTGYPPSYVKLDLPLQ